MAHMRQQIRDAVAAALTGLPTTAGRVHVGRTRPLPTDHQPTLLIYTLVEVSSRAVAGRPPLQERRLDLLVEGRVVSSVAPDDDLDTIAAEVEGALAASPRLGGLTMDLSLAGTEVLIEAQGERHVGRIGLTWRAVYRIAEGAPTAPA